jgi:ribokinase
MGELDVVVVGGINTDYTIKGPRLPEPGSSVQGTEFQEGPGGKGSNQAIAAARLGARAALVGRVGNDERGRRSLARLEEDHVDTSAIATDPDAPTGAALIMVNDAGDKQIFTAPGANLKLGEADIMDAREILARAKVVLCQLELPVQVVAAAVRLARAAGARVVLDAAPAIPLPEDLLRDVHVIRADAGEAEILTGAQVRDIHTARIAAENLIRRGAGAACVGTPGGNLLHSPEGELWLPHLPVRAVDETGADDAFAGGLAATLARGQPLREAVRFAHAAAALKTTNFGAQAGLPWRAEVEGLLEDFAERLPSVLWPSTGTWSRSSASDGS